ncbi:MAG: hypothetical protein PHG40_04565 [Candidatus Omnitrophica bacterium]|nr:hypothetical protein [Candidatus Omnitrophota bacterium]
MDKEEALNDFIKSLRISLTSASTYFKEHPGFIKSAEDFKQKTDHLLTFLNPINIDFSANSLSMDGKALKGMQFYTELAGIFHLRKIKSLRIEIGVTLQELIDVLIVVSAPRREILRQGGVNNILDKNIRHIFIEELDYSQFLRDPAEGLDAWIYALKKSMQKNDLAQINACADSLGMVIGRAELRELLQDQGLKQDIFELLSRLKDSDKKRFDNCTRELFRNFTKYKDTLSAAQITELTFYFRQLNEEDLAGLLWQELSTDNNFDVLTMNLFSKIAGEGKEKAISSSLLNKIIDKDSLRNNPEALKRIDGLLKKSQGADIPEIYRHTMLALLEDISFDKRMLFDRSLLKTNYRFILISLLQSEESQKRLAMVAQKAGQELAAAAQEGNLDYLKTALEISQKERIKRPELKSLFDNFDKEIFATVEGLAWTDQISPDLDCLVRNISILKQDAGFYLERFFTEGKVSSYALELFFRFFPEQIGLFEQKFKERHSDTDFLFRLIQQIRKIDSRILPEILRKLFPHANELVKIEILKSMQGLSGVDKEFLFSILKEADISLKRQALVILDKSQDARDEVIRILFGIPNFLGLKNKMILQNLIAVEQSKYKAAGDYLVSLSRKIYPWNISIARKAQEILRSWNV